MNTLFKNSKNEEAAQSTELGYSLYFVWYGVGLFVLMMAFMQ